VTQKAYTALETLSEIVLFAPQALAGRLIHPLLTDLMRFILVSFGFVLFHFVSFCFILFHFVSFCSHLRLRLQRSHFLRLAFQRLFRARQLSLPGWAGGGCQGVRTGFIRGSERESVSSYLFYTKYTCCIYLLALGQPYPPKH
jgi:hypothetical protein